MELQVLQESDISHNIFKYNNMIQTKTFQNSILSRFHERITIIVNFVGKKIPINIKESKMDKGINIFLRNCKQIVDLMIHEMAAS